MSLRMTPILVCDGCGSEIDIDTYFSLHPTGQPTPQKNVDQPLKRDFCCEACQAWWEAEYPETGAWGPAWEERDWWRENQAHIPLRSVPEEEPLTNNRSYYENPEPLK